MHIRIKEGGGDLMIEDWSDMYKTQTGKVPYQVQWSPVGLVRAKHNNEATWSYAPCCHAKFAFVIGDQLLASAKEGVNDNLPVLYYNGASR